MTNKVTAVKLDDNGFVELARMENGVEITLENLMYMAKVTGVDGLFVAHDFEQSKDVILADEDIPVIGA